MLIARRLCRLLPIIWIASLSIGSAHAQRSVHFNGFYRVTHPANIAEQFVLFHAASLATLWSIYGEANAPIPPTWEPHRSEPAVLAALDNRSFTLVILEGEALVSPNFFSCTLPGQDLLELRKESNGHFKIAWRVNGNVTIVDTLPPLPLGTQKTFHSSFAASTNFGTNTTVPRRCLRRLLPTPDILQPPS